jgi:hypothetical protein
MMMMELAKNVMMIMVLMKMIGVHVLKKINLMTNIIQKMKVLVIFCVQMIFPNAILVNIIQLLKRLNALNVKKDMFYQYMKINAYQKKA